MTETKGLLQLSLRLSHKSRISPCLKACRAQCRLMLAHHGLYRLQSAAQPAQLLQTVSIPSPMPCAAGGLEAERLGAVDALGVPPGVLAAPGQGSGWQPGAGPEQPVPRRRPPLPGGAPSACLGLLPCPSSIPEAPYPPTSKKSLHTSLPRRYTSKQHLLAALKLSCTAAWPPPGCKAACKASPCV